MIVPRLPLKTVLSRISPGGLRWAISASGTPCRTAIVRKITSRLIALKLAVAEVPETEGGCHKQHGQQRPARHRDPWQQARPSRQGDGQQQAVEQVGRYQDLAGGDRPKEKVEAQPEQDRQRVAAANRQQPPFDDAPLRAAEDRLDQQVAGQQHEQHQSAEQTEAERQAAGQQEAVGQRERYEDDDGSQSGVTVGS